MGEWIPPGNKQKVKFVLFMDLATKLRIVQPLYKYNFLEMRSETADDVLKAFSERWLGTFPKPRVLVLDAAKTFAADAVHDFCYHLNILVSFVAEKEAWAHGALEAGVQDLKMTASAIHLEEREQDPFISLYLATSALNSTEYTAGYSSLQWAYGREYSLNDEDVRTFSLSQYKDEFAKLVTAREKAQAIATSTRARRVLSRLNNTTVRQPLRFLQANGPGEDLETCVAEGTILRSSGRTTKVWQASLDWSRESGFQRDFTSSRWRP